MTKWLIRIFKQWMHDKYKITSTQQGEKKHCKLQCGWKSLEWMSLCENKNKSAISILLMKHISVYCRNGQKEVFLIFFLKILILWVLVIQLHRLGSQKIARVLLGTSICCLVLPMSHFPEESIFNFGNNFLRYLTSK